MPFPPPKTPWLKSRMLQPRTNIRAWDWRSVTACDRYSSAPAPPQPACDSSVEDKTTGPVSASVGGAKTDDAEMTSRDASAGGAAARWLLGTARFPAPRLSPPASRPRPLGRLAPWRDSALRARGEDAAAASSPGQASASWNQLPPVPGSSPSVWKPVASRPPRRAL